MIGTKLGPYEIVAKLGEGGMGVVWRAKDSKLRREVARGGMAKLLDGLSTDCGIVRVSADRRRLSMLDSREEGDLWLASRDARAGS